jgi:hypothetical protein
MRRASEDEAPLPPALSDDEQAFRASLERLVDWYRVPQAGALVRAFVPGAFVLLPLGSILVALSMLPQLPVSMTVRPLLTVCGILVTAAGPLWALRQLLRAIRADLYVAIRLDGLGVRLDPAREEQVYAWDRIGEVRYDPERAALCLELHDQAEPVCVPGPFAELTTEELARRVRDARRLAVWNRLSPRYAFRESPAK